MRLEPIESPQHLMTRFAFWMTKRRFGKVMTPMKVVTARLPGSERLSWEIAKFALNRVPLDHELHYLLSVHVSRVNGCAFCEDLGRSIAVQDKMPLDKFDALGDYRTSQLFSARERAALGYVEEATRNKKVSDQTFEELRRHFSDQEIVAITWVGAIENFYNLVNIPLEIESDGICSIVQARAARTPVPEARA